MLGNPTLLILRIMFATVTPVRHFRELSVSISWTIVDSLRKPGDVCDLAQAGNASREGERSDTNGRHRRRPDAHLHIPWGAAAFPRLQSLRVIDD